MASVSEPVRVSTPVVALKLPVMFAVSVKASTSSELTRPPVILMVADSILVSSTSVMVRAASITCAPSPSV